MQPNIHTPLFHVHVSGVLGWKKILIYKVQGGCILINGNGRILSDGEAVGEVTRRSPASDRGTAVAAAFRGRILRAELVRGFPAQFPARQFYRLYSDDSEMGTMVCNTYCNTRFKLEVKDGRPDEAWFFGYCALVLRMGFDT